MSLAASQGFLSPDPHHTLTNQRNCAIIKTLSDKLKSNTIEVSTLKILRKENCTDSGFCPLPSISFQVFTRNFI